MRKTDEFENFLKRELEKNKYAITDNGFTEGVISNLPTNTDFLFNRKVILYISSALSVFVFFISNGYKALILSIIDIFNNGVHWIKPTLISFFVILVFLTVSFIISRFEHYEDLI
jgi:hypothetical protein